MSNTSVDLPPGAFYLPSSISSKEEAGLVRHLDAGEWSMELKRRVQHFGYHYDYRARTVTSDAYLGPLPGWLWYLNDRLVAKGLFASAPDQVIANEYLPGQGISAHIDCVPCFDDTIVSLSLLSECEMVFRERRGGAKLTVILEPCSAVVMTGAARYEWTHEIPARKSDGIDGMKVERARRISLTFRKVIRTTYQVVIACCVGVIWEVKSLHLDERDLRSKAEFRIVTIERESFVAISMQSLT